MNKSVLKIFLVLALGMTICLPGLAMGDIIIVGDPLNVGSWAQAFNESGVGSFNKMEFFIVSDTTDFEPPGISSFTASGWTGSLLNPDYILALGTPATINTNFTLQWITNQPIAFEVDMLAWSGASVVDRAHASWNGSAWNFTVLSNVAGNYDRSAAAPIPPTVLLMGSGLLGLVGFEWRRRKQT